jgi:hypothetical protein
LITRSGLSRAKRWRHRIGGALTAALLPGQTRAMLA